MCSLCVKTLSASFAVTPGQPVGLTDASLPSERHLSSVMGFVQLTWPRLALGSGTFIRVLELNAESLGRKQTSFTQWAEYGLNRIFRLYPMNLLTVLGDSSLTQDSHTVTPNHLPPLSPQLVVTEGAFTTDPARNRHL